MTYLAISDRSIFNPLPSSFHRKGSSRERKTFSCSKVLLKSPLCFGLAECIFLFCHISYQSLINVFYKILLKVFTLLPLLDVNGTINFCFAKASKRPCICLQFIKYSCLGWLHKPLFFNSPCPKLSTILLSVYFLSSLFLADWMERNRKKCSTGQQMLILGTTHMVLGNQPLLTLLEQRGWTRWPSEIPSNLDHSLILFDSCILTAVS